MALMLELDHMAVFAPTLAVGVAHVRECLGVEVPAGGTHIQMGTHNHLMRLGKDEFLEIIAIDPDAAKPRQPRWFGLDTYSEHHARLGTWVLRSADLEATLHEMPPSVGQATRITRGDLSWKISVPDDGSMPFDGAFPSVLEWPSEPFPGSRMPDRGCSLQKLVVSHPNANIIKERLRHWLRDERVEFHRNDKPSLEAYIQTPFGLRTL